MGDFRMASRRPAMETLLLPQEGRGIPLRLVHAKTDSASGSPWPLARVEL